MELHEATAGFTCGFCGAGKPRATRLLAGPGALICTGCVDLAREAIGEADRVAEAGHTDPSAAALRCSFCDTPGNQVGRLVAGPGVYICDRCVRLCDEVLAVRQG